MTKLKIYIPQTTCQCARENQIENVISHAANESKTMPLIFFGANVVAMARTGSGKTAVFLVPMLERLLCHAPQSGPMAPILSPTRDLAFQTLKFALDLGHFTG